MQPEYRRELAPEAAGLIRTRYPQGLLKVGPIGQRESGRFRPSHDIEDTARFLDRNGVGVFGVVIGNVAAKKGGVGNLPGSADPGCERLMNTRTGTGKIRLVGVTGRGQLR